MSVWKTQVRGAPGLWEDDVEMDKKPDENKQANSENTKIEDKRPHFKNVVVPVEKVPMTTLKQEEFVYTRSKKRTENAALDEYLNRRFNSAGHAWRPYLAERRATLRAGPKIPSIGAKNMVKNNFHSVKVSWRELMYSIEVWRSSLKSIEGCQGMGCVSFFVFLRWLFFLNIFIFLLLFWSVTFFQVAFSEKSSYDKDLTGDTYSTSTAVTCSASYSPTVSTKVGNRILDFFQGTGWMEDTSMFYGHYNSKKVSLAASGYNLPLAYFLTVVAVMLFSLVFMVHNTLSNFKDAVLAKENSKHANYCNMVFAGTDFSVSEGSALQQKQMSIYRGLESDLEEQRFQCNSAKRTGAQKCRLYTARFIINFLILVMLGGGGAAIYYAQDYSASFTTKTDVSAKYNRFVILLVQFLPSIVISLLNGILPLIFSVLVNFESVRPATVIKLTLIRTVFLKLASLAMIMVSLYVQITCSDKDSCSIGQNNCAAIECWESYVGAAIYKLMVTDLIVSVVMTFAVELPRKLIATKCGCGLAKKIGPPEFDIPKNVLDIVYGQTLCWLGLYYSPLIPAVSVFRFFVIFYLKKLSAVYNTVPPQKPYLASKSNSFFTVILMIAFFMVCVPVGYTVSRMNPSMMCGPFRIYSRPSDIIQVQINNAANWFQTIWHIITSSAVIAALIILLLLGIYYCSALNSARKGLLEMMKEQLVMEGKDKQYLLSRISELSGGQPPRQKPPSYQNSQLKTIDETKIVKNGKVHSGNLKNGDVGMENHVPPPAQYHKMPSTITTISPPPIFNESSGQYHTTAIDAKPRTGMQPALVDW